LSLDNFKGSVRIVAWEAGRQGRASVPASGL
jgi:hypothetical protein